MRNHYTKNYRQPRSAESGRNSSPGRAHAWLSSTELSALKSCLQVTLDRLSRRLYLPICVYIFIHSYTHATINLKKRSYKFEREQGEVYGRV